MMKRMCYICGRVIKKDEFLEHNDNEFTIVELHNIWQSPYIRLVCCNCRRILRNKHAALSTAGSWRQYYFKYKDIYDRFKQWD